MNQSVLQHTQQADRFIQVSLFHQGVNLRVIAQSFHAPHSSVTGDQEPFTGVRQADIRLRDMQERGRG